MSARNGTQAAARAEERPESQGSERSEEEHADEERGAPTEGATAPNQGVCSENSSKSPMVSERHRQEATQRYPKDTVIEYSNGFRKILLRFPKDTKAFLQPGEIFGCGITAGRGGIFGISVTCGCYQRLPGAPWQGVGGHPLVSKLQRFGTSAAQTVFVIHAPHIVATVTSAAVMPVLRRG